MTRHGPAAVAMAVVLAVVLAASACTNGGGSTSSEGGGATSGSTSTRSQATDRASVLTGAATRVIAPAYRQLAEAARGLEEAAAACDLDRSQAAWKATRIAYMKSIAAAGVGPAQEQRLLPAVDFWPSDPAGIQAFAAGPGPFTIEAVRALGARQRGLHALEVLLFAEGSFGRPQCLVASLLSTLVRRAADDAAAAWTDLAPRFGSRDRALADLVSSATQAIGLVEGEQLGMPAGLRRGAEVKAALVRGRNALVDVAAVLAGTTALLEAAVSPLLTPDLAGRMNAALAAAEAAAQTIPAPLEVAVVSDRPQVIAAIQAAKVIEVLLATEVTSVLGVTLNFNPNDGD